MKPSIRHTLLALTLITVGNAGCTTSAYDSAYYDPYTYYSYYPADVYYSSYYWADPYYFYYLDGAGSTPIVYSDGGTTVITTDAGTTTVARTSIGDTIRALARGEAVCGSNVTITPKLIVNPCPTNGNDMVRGGVTLVFSSCALPAGGTLDGTVDVTTSRTSSDTTCGAATTITINQNTSVTNLSYTGPSGRRILIPSQTGTGTTTFGLGQTPTTAQANIAGNLQIFDINGNSVADKSYTGDVTITPASNRASYSIDGTLTLEDADNSGTTTLTAMGLTRTTDCCRPTAGSLSITRTGTGSFGLHTWRFDSSTCGGATFDGKNITLATCL